jgi:hypothetical protein
LERLLAIEIEVAEARRHAGRLRFACLPHLTRWPISTSVPQRGIDEKLIRELASLRLLDDAGNVLFVGPPGTGKTTSWGCSGRYRSSCSFPTGTCSQGAAPIWTTASAGSAVYSLTRKPVRSSTSTVTRTSIRLSFYAARSSFAAAASSSALGSGRS